MTAVSALALILTLVETRAVQDGSHALLYTTDTLDCLCLFWMNEIINRRG